MAFEDIFKNVSDIAITLFAKEKKKCTFREQTGASSYDPVTGKNVPIYADHPTLAAFVDLDDTEQMDLSSRSEIEKALISGKYLAVTPSKNDLIVKHDNSVYIVVRVKTDMYKALFTCYVKEINNG